jgi:hypothetical protein
VCELFLIFTLLPCCLVLFCTLKWVFWTRPRQRGVRYKHAETSTLLPVSTWYLSSSRIREDSLPDKRLLSFFNSPRQKYAHNDKVPYNFRRSCLKQPGSQIPSFNYEVRFSCNQYKPKNAVSPTKQWGATQLSQMLFVKGNSFNKNA